MSICHLHIFLLNCVYMGVLGYFPVYLVTFGFNSSLRETPLTPLASVLQISTAVVKKHTDMFVNVVNKYTVNMQKLKTFLKECRCFERVECKDLRLV